MITYDQYLKSIQEGFVFSDDDKVIYFDPRSEEIINTTFGKGKSKAPYTKKLSFGEVTSTYKKAKNILKIGRAELTRTQTLLDSKALVPG